MHTLNGIQHSFIKKNKYPDTVRLQISTLSTLFIYLTSSAVICANTHVGHV